jgi:hypothetical protein
MMGNIRAVSSYDNTSPGKGWDQVPDRASDGGGKM